MKFGRYLEDTQVPEWKRAYINYKALKKKITAIKEQLASERKTPKLGDNPIKSLNERIKNGSIFTPSPTTIRRRTTESRVGVATSAPPVTTKFSPGRSVKTVSTSPGTKDTPGGEPSGTNRTPGNRQEYGTFGQSPPISSEREQKHAAPSSPPVMLLPPPIKSISDLHVNEQETVGVEGSKRPRVTLQASSPDGVPTSQIVNSPMTPGTFSRRPRLFTALTAATRRGSVSTIGRVPTSLAEVLAELTPLEQEFVDALDAELSKVENFYREREKEAILRSNLIKVQLHELKDHRKIFHAYEEQHPTILPKVIGKMAAHIVPQSLGLNHPATEEDQQLHRLTPSTSQQGGRNASPHPTKFDPDEYHNAKKRLKKALLEFYRGVEYLSNYRILNLTGFRKALKKFEKVTSIRISQLYFAEKIDPSVLSNATPVENMLDEIEKLFAARFEGGDRKKARNRLRAHFKERSHHYSTFRTGLYIGLSIPAFIAGIYSSFQAPTREAVPAWAALLQIYLAFFIPVVFGLLVSLNLIVWAHVRINYIFIFELDVRTVVDSREYAELPAFLLMMLAYAFWLSFSGLPSRVAPTVWPMAWLVATILILVNPLPVFYPYSRRWILGESASLFLSGTRRVEFPDFFLGDQYCSMVYSLTSLYWMGCLYGSHWTLPWGRCELPLWVFPWLLATLPSWIRFIQCIRRYADSWQMLHLVNGGKYCSGILYYALYYHWRNVGSPRSKSFVAYVFFACVTSIYATAWDLLMDWSLLQRGARYPLLRKEIMYTNQIWFYYFAIVTNIIVRFGWIIYLPIPGPSPNVRAGIYAIAEAFRRFQWNFLRLENEHLGNADQYRVTREVPLPYTFDPAELSDGEDEDDGTRSARRSPLRLSRPSPFATAAAST
ncbi:hypothetical protein FRC19_010139 [Serendipita sp. 401]|nr:hypothetical protein FRC19_010139 [Serendipita sp. 401]